MICLLKNRINSFLKSKNFCDPFYNSREQSFVRHTFRLLTSWSVVCDVWFLEPQKRRKGETVLEFTDRVKAMIANKAGLRNVNWDGYLKYFRPSERFIEERRKLFASSLIKRFSTLDLTQLEQNLTQKDDSTLKSKSE